MSGDAEWDRLRDAVGDALEAGAMDAEAALRRAAGDDPGVLGLARELLAHRDAPGFMEPPLRGAAGLLVAQAAAERAIGRRFGPYRVTGVISSGSMGAVYLAARDDNAFERTVVIKSLPGVLHGAEAMERFERERRLLARLSHPGIASLLDGGCTDDGEPYLVIEHVDGEPLARRVLVPDGSPRACTRAVRAVCEAVRHAHQSLIIHRDLKPANILVTRDGATKLLDFGISTLIDRADPSGATLVRALTPRYASPEQLLGEPVTTASDVFSLGVILYELLSGVAPWPDGESAAQVSARTAPRSPCQDRDLAAVTLKAVSLDPHERYPSAEAFLADLDRYLADRPVMARSPGAAYRLRKFLLRHRGASAAVAAGLVGAAGLLIWGAVGMEIERDRTRRALASASEINAFLAQTLESADAGAASGRELTIRSLLDDASARLDRDLADRPAAAGPLHLTLARAYRSVGQIAASRAHLERAVEMLRQAGRGSEAPLATALEDLAGAADVDGDPTRARGLLREVIAIRRDLEGAGSEAALRTLMLLGSIQGDPPDPAAPALLKEALEGYRALGPGGRAGVAACLEGLAADAESRSDPAAGAAYREETLAVIRDLYGDESDRTATALARLGEMYTKCHEYDRAERDIREALEIGVRLHGADHPTVTFQMLLLADVLEGEGKTDDAASQYEDALRIALARLPEDHYIPVTIHRKYGDFLERRGNHAEAQAQFVAAYTGCVSMFGPDHAGSRSAARAMAASLEASGAVQQVAEWRARAGGQATGIP